MFKNTYDDFAADLEKNLKTAEQAPIVAKNYKQETAIKHLLVAANLLEDLGLEKHASNITKVLSKFAQESDLATNGLTSEKMVDNLKEKGTVFNADDEDLSIEEPEEDLTFSDEELTGDANSFYSSESPTSKEINLVGTCSSITKLLRAMVQFWKDNSQFTQEVDGTPNETYTSNAISILEDAARGMAAIESNMY